jgi:subtilisin family serine protease
MKILLVLLLVLYTISQVVEPELINTLKLKSKAQIIVSLKDKIDLDNLVLKGKNFYDYNADERAEIILHKFTEFSTFSQKGLVNELKGKYEFEVLWIINGILIKNADQELVEKLSLRKDISQISLDKEYKVEEVEERSKVFVPRTSSVNETIEFNVKWVKAPEVWAMGFNGQGIVVGVGDTGLNHNHEAIVRAYRGTKGTGPFTFDHNYNWYDPSGSKSPVDGKNF